MLSSLALIQSLSVKAIKITITSLSSNNISETLFYIRVFSRKELSPIVISLFLEQLFSFELKNDFRNKVKIMYVGYKILCFNYFEVAYIKDCIKIMLKRHNLKTIRKCKNNINRKIKCITKTLLLADFIFMVLIMLKLINTIFIFQLHLFLIFKKGFLIIKKLNYK